MPLRLLGKKSWNVYNQDNIDRVRRDEATARAAEQEAEKRRLDNESDDRLALLRGESLTDVAKNGNVLAVAAKRKREDEWERAHRLANSKHEAGERTVETGPSFDQLSNMRMIDAAGRHKGKSELPWYNNINSEAPTQQRKDVWGNSDVNRKGRDQQRTDASDPLLAMKKGVKQLKEIEKKREAFREERERDLVEIEEMARRRERHERRKKERHKRHHHHRRRSVSDGDDTVPGKQHHRHRSRHKSSEREDLTVKPRQTPQNINDS